MGGFKKGIWIARDQDGELYAYAAKPKKHTISIMRMCRFEPTGVGANRTMQLPSSWFKHITFENSPVFVPLTEDFVEQFIKN
jgi:hypothetical protein